MTNGIWSYIRICIAKAGIITAQLVAGSVALMIGASLGVFLPVSIVDDPIGFERFSSGSILVYLLAMLLSLSIGFSGMLASAAAVYLIGRGS